MSIQSEQEGRIMGKATGFLEYERVENPGQEPLERRNRVHAVWIAVFHSVRTESQSWAWYPAVR